jgi:hypothetical protein
MKKVRIKKRIFLRDAITYQSKPDYDDWGIDTYWSCSDWITWHAQLKKKFGQTEANKIWLTAWNKQDAWENNYNWCKYNSDFNNFLNREKIQGASHVVAKVFVNTTKGIENTSEIFSGVTSILKNKFVLASLLGLTGYIAYKKFN